MWLDLDGFWAELGEFLAAPNVAVAATSRLVAEQVLFTETYIYIYIHIHMYIER